MSSSRFILLLLYVCGLLRVADANHCTDFNVIRKRLEDSEAAFKYCPDDGISSTDMCQGTVKTKELSRIVFSEISWDDIVVYVLVQSKTVQTHSLMHWLGLFPAGQSLHLAFIGDHCDEPCDDHVSRFAASVLAAQGNRIKLTIKVVRGLKDVDHGPARVACKTLTGMHEILKRFPTKKYFFKINEDTVIYPANLQKFISTLDSVVKADTEPLYFGSILHLFRGHPLCDEMGIDNNGDPTYPNKKGWLAGDPTCHTQGEAYGFNNVAMKHFSNVSLCTVGMDLEAMQEDVYFGWKLWRDLKVSPIHCGAFRPHGLSETVRYTREHPESLDLSVDHVISIGEYHKRIY